MLDNINWQQNSTHDAGYNKESDMSALNDVPIDSFIKGDGKEYGEAIKKYYEQYSFKQTPTFKLNWLGILIGLWVLGVIFFVGKCEGAKSERLKQEYKSVRAEINTVHEEKKQDAITTSETSKKAVKRAYTIRDGIKRELPRMKDTTDDYKKELILKFKP